MPIDSLCSGCGKTLRVNDEFIGRKARCPICGFVYVVGGVGVVEAAQGQIVSDPTTVETAHAAEPVTQSIGTNETTLTSEVPIQSFNPVASFFVRTPNSIVYGPTDTETVLDWINQKRLDDTCHIREQSSEQWLGIAAWRFQFRKLQNPMSSQVYQPQNQFGAVPLSTVQSAGNIKPGNGMVVLVLGIVSWVLCPTGLGAWICGILAIIFATVEVGKIRDGQSPRSEKTLVLIGMWLGIANLMVWALSIVGIIVISIFSA